MSPAVPNSLPDFERVVAALESLRKKQEHIEQREKIAAALALLRALRADFERYAHCGYYCPNKGSPTPPKRCTCGASAARERLGLR